MVRSCLACLLIVLPCQVGITADEVESSTLVGRIIARGDVPKQELIKPIRDFKDPIPNESLVVNPKNRGIANVVVWLRESKDNPLPDQLPHAANRPKNPGEDNSVVTLRFKEGRIVPRIAIVRTSQTLKVENADAVGHAPNAQLIRNVPFHPIVPPKKTFEQLLKKNEQLPMVCTCPLHPWEKAYIVVKDHPYAAATDADGRFKIENLPRGSWTFVLWHEKFGYLTRLFQNGRPIRLAKGRLTIDFKKANVDLGTVEMFDLKPVVGKAEAN